MNDMVVIQVATIVLFIKSRRDKWFYRTYFKFFTILQLIMIIRVSKARVIFFGATQILSEHH